MEQNTDENKIEANKADRDGEPANQKSKALKQPDHPIAVAIDRLVHRARDIKMAARMTIPFAAEVTKRQFEKIGKILEKNGPLLENSDRHQRVLAQKEVNNALIRLERLQKSAVPEVIEKGLFLALFSAYDAFTGDLLTGLYTRKPILFNSLGKTITFAEVLSASSVEELKLQVLNDDIESIRRKSYIEQFTTFAQRFDVKLTGFDRWAAFVECSQRRNVITHCDGIVTEQYLKICREAGNEESSLAPLGSKLKLGKTYLFGACELAIEVGIKLGQTLWRKTLPSELKEADRQLMNALYEALEVGIWPRARMIGEYAFGLRQTASDLDKKTITINYAQALKRDGDDSRARQILQEVDWTAAINDFKLARAVLLEQYDEASNLMRQIGTKGEMLTEAGYHTWPLFIEFRQTDQFAQVYQEIFGHPYSDKLKEDITTASRFVAAAAAEPSKSEALENSENPLTSETENNTSNVIAEQT